MLTVSVARDKGFQDRNIQVTFISTRFACFPRIRCAKTIGYLILSTTYHLRMETGNNELYTNIIHLFRGRYNITLHHTRRRLLDVDCHILS